MPHVVAYDDVKATRTHRIVDGDKSAWRTNYMQPGDETPDQPQAFLAECGPQRVLRTHFHEQDQFQVFVSGTGSAGRHPIQPFQVHFARAHTPYGPIVAADQGVGFLTLRTRKDPGAQYLPEKREVLDRVADRRPWQLTRAVEFPRTGEPFAIRPLADMQDEHGLAAYAISMQPGATSMAPDPAASNGQYLVVLGGSLLHAGREHEATTVVFVRPDEGPFQLKAGAQGLDAIALHFPRVAGAPARAMESADDAEGGEYKVWHCVLCAFVYDEAAGLPEEGIAPGTRWADVPDNWGCPDCSAKKSDFEMVEF